MTIKADGSWRSRLDSTTVSKLRAALDESFDQSVEKLKKAKEGDDAAAIKAAMEKLAQASHKLAEALYRAKAEEQQASEQKDEQPKDEKEEPDSGKKGDDVIDADYEVRE